jgi:hypothetical protein
MGVTDGMNRSLSRVAYTEWYSCTNLENFIILNGIKVSTPWEKG